MNKPALAATALIATTAIVLLGVGAGKFGPSLKRSDQAAPGPNALAAEVGTAAPVKEAPPRGLSPEAERVFQLICQGQAEAAEHLLDGLHGDPAAPALRARMLMHGNDIFSTMSPVLNNPEFEFRVRATMDGKEDVPFRHIVRGFNITAGLNPDLKPFLADLLCDGILTSVDRGVTLTCLEGVFFHPNAAAFEHDAMHEPGVPMNYVVLALDGALEMMPQPNMRVGMNMFHRQLKEASGGFIPIGLWVELLPLAAGYDAGIAKRVAPRVDAVVQRCRAAGRYATGVILTAGFNGVEAGVNELANVVREAAGKGTQERQMALIAMGTFCTPKDSIPFVKKALAKDETFRAAWEKLTAAEPESYKAFKRVVAL